MARGQCGVGVHHGTGSQWGCNWVSLMTMGHIVRLWGCFSCLSHPVPWAALTVGIQGVRWATGYSFSGKQLQCWRETHITNNLHGFQKFVLKQSF